MASILLVEDDRVLVRIWSRLLSNHGHKVGCAMSLKRARKLLRDPEQRYDLVLLDLELPDGDGAELLPLIHSLPVLPAVAVVSAHFDGIRAVNLLGRCAAGVPKPLPEHTLLELVETIVGQRMAVVVRAFAAEFGLSEGEAELLRVAALGASREEACVELSLSYATINEYWRRIFAKTGFAKQRRLLGALFRFGMQGPGQA